MECTSLLFTSLHFFHFTSLPRRGIKVMRITEPVSLSAGVPVLLNTLRRLERRTTKKNPRVDLVPFDLSQNGRSHALTFPNINSTLAKHSLRQTPIDLNTLKHAQCAPDSASVLLPCACRPLTRFQGAEINRLRSCA